MIDPATLPAARRATLAGAAVELGRAMADIHRTGGSPLALFTGGRAPEALRHYPDGDAYDFVSHAQLYFHTHRAGELGHVHCFLRSRGMPAGLAPLVPIAEADPPCHLIAIGFGPDGQASELFTTNRWVTGEAWYAAPAIIPMLPRFRINVSGPNALVGRWVTAVVALMAPLIEDLVHQRDAAVRALLQRLQKLP